MSSHSQGRARSAGAATDRPSGGRSAADREDRFSDSWRWRTILDAAASMFATHGYEATSISHIADRVGITKASVYHYIDTKDDLLYHVLVEIHDSHLRRFQEYAQVPGGPLERLRAFIEGHAKVNIAEIDRGAVFYLNFDSLSESRRAEILDRRRQFDSFLRGLLAEGQRDGVVRADLDVELAALAILTALNSFHIWWDPKRAADKDVAGQYADMFLAAVAVP
jgi:TetR/AcrR family transcriptional regulator, cholesterol catabolism regulator